MNIVDFHELVLGLLLNILLSVNLFLIRPFIEYFTEVQIFSA